MKKESPSTPVSAILPIILTAFIDMLGIGIIIPVMAPLIINNETGILAASVSLNSRHIIFGFLLSAYPLAQFFGAPMLGALSDRYGRKKLLSLSLAGSLFGYVIFAMGILLNSIELLVAGRLIDGFTGGNISIVYSAISDISGPKEKARNFGLIGMAFGLGFIIGPFIGGILADDKLVGWFGPTVPFFGAALLCGFNLIILSFLFPETLKNPSSRPVRLLSGFINIRKAFSLPNLRTMFTVVFFLTLGFAFFTQFFSVYMIDKFEYSSSDLGLVFAYIGLFIAFTQGVLLRPVTRRFRPAQVVTVSALALAVVLPLLLLPKESFWIYLILPLIAFSHGTSQPNVNAVVSGLAAPDQQGEILGINQSITALGNAIPPIIAGFLSSIDGTIPTLAAAGFTFVGWLVFVFVFRS